VDYKRLKKKGKEDSVFWSEIKANFYGFIKQPLGAIITVFMSLAPYRIKMYLFNYNKSLKEVERELK